MGDGRFDAYQNVYKQITVAQASINKPQIRKDGSDVGDEIDRVITTALIEARPTYLTLPTDLVAGEKSCFQTLRCALTKDSRNSANTSRTAGQANHHGEHQEEPGRTESVAEGRRAHYRANLFNVQASQEAYRACRCMCYPL